LLWLQYNLKEGRNSSTNPLHWRYWFGELETRWLAVFRILFAALLLKDAVYHLFLAQRFYSDTGVLPRASLLDSLARTFRFSLMDAIAYSDLAILFFMLWIIVLIALMFGYRVRLMSVLNFIIMLSVHERDVYILTGADTAMRVMSFWLMFAPIGQDYSLDALWRRQRGESLESSAFALPIRLLQWQLIMVYCCTGYLKMIGPIWGRGEVMHYVLQLDTFMLPFGYWMRSWPTSLLSLLSYYALVAEILIPIFLLFPLFWRWTRVLAFLLALGLHGGIALVLAIPDFSIVMLISFLNFFDNDWLKWLEQRFQPHFQAIEARFLALIPYLYPQTWRPKPDGRFDRIALSLILMPLFLLVIWWNVLQTSYYNDDAYVDAPYSRPISYPPEPFETILKRGENLLQLIGLWQYWDMFSPLPIQYDGFIVIEGEFENGQFLDLITGQPVDYEHPNRWYWGPEMRWEKWEENIYGGNNEALRRSWAAYFCRYYETLPYGERLARLEIQMVRRDSYAPDASPNEPYTTTIWYHWCYDEYAPQGRLPELFATVEAASDEEEQ
jgi:hypothetical protein